MKQRREHRELQEPMGIVIATGTRGEVTPQFAAFVWGPVPEVEVWPVAAEAKAA